MPAGISEGGLPMRAKMATCAPLAAKVRSTFLAKETTSSALKCVVSPPPMLAELKPGAADTLPQRDKLKIQIINWRMVSNQFLVVGCCNAWLGGKTETVSSLTGKGVPIGLLAAFIREPPA